MTIFKYFKTFLVFACLSNFFFFFLIGHIALFVNQVQQRNLGVSGRIFTIENTRARGRAGNMLKLKVNFLPEIITLSKEVRNLKWLSFRVPLAIVNKAHQANQLYPFAISLIESVRTYERTCEKVEERSSISLLVAGLKKEVQVLITEGITLVWESYKLDPYVQRLAETVFNFQEKVSVEAVSPFSSVHSISILVIILLLFSLPSFFFLSVFRWMTSC